MHGGSDPNFLGFMIQGRVVADDSRTGIFASGTNLNLRCDSVSPYMQQCMQIKVVFCLFLQTAATHTNAENKTSVPLSWTAPPVGTGPIRFRCVCYINVNAWSLTVHKLNVIHYKKIHACNRPQVANYGKNKIELSNFNTVLL